MSLRTEFISIAELECSHSRGQHPCKFIVGTSTGLAWYTNIAKVSLSWNITMAVVRSCKAPYIFYNTKHNAREYFTASCINTWRKNILYHNIHGMSKEKKNGCQKFTNWYSLTDCKKKTLISTCQSVLVDVFLSNIPNSYKCSVNNFETAKCLL